MAQSLQRDQSIDQLARQTDVVIIGGGIAGISLALTLPATAAVTLITKNALGESNTRYAQGGLAAAVGMRDTAASHLADTLSAGAGHCDLLAVQTLVNGADAAIDQLLAAGTRFDPAHANADEESTALIAGQALALGHEAAHSHHRVLHAHGDATGAEIERALVATLRTRTNVTVLEYTFATALMREGDRCTGVRIVTPEGQHTTITARAVVLATGGAGRLWRRTSNPAGDRRWLGAGLACWCRVNGSRIRAVPPDRAGAARPWHADVPDLRGRAWRGGVSAQPCWRTIHAKLSARRTRGA
jgi:L-aspartate oxidase